MAPVRPNARYFVDGLSTVSVCKAPGGMVIAEPGPRSNLVLNLEDHAAVQHVIGLAPAGSVQRGGRPSRRLHLEELVLIISVSRIDLDREDRVRSGQLDTFAGGCVGPDASCQRR